MSRAIRYAERTHCGETMSTRHVTCPYYSYRPAVHSPQPRAETCGPTQATTD